MDRPQPVRFSKPADERQVSHSITLARSAEFIMVPAVTMADLVGAIPAGRFSILKMDIEGAEVAVLGTIGEWPVLPQQILVEFDVLCEPGPASKREVETTDALLRSHGYLCRHFDGLRNYLYVLS